MLPFSLGTFQGEGGSSSSTTYIITTPANEYKRMQQVLPNLGYSHKFLPSHHRIFAEQKKLVPQITKDTFGIEKIYLNSTGELSQFITVIFGKDLIHYVIHSGGP